jgi:hypothetical protein
MDGLWTAEFGSSLGDFGGGVVFFRDGRLAGGDNGYFYLGEYAVEGTTLRATLRIAPFIKDHQSVFHTIGRELDLELVGRLTDQKHAIAQGIARGIPDVKIGVKLTKRS